RGPRPQGPLGHVPLSAEDPGRPRAAAEPAEAPTDGDETDRGGSAEDDPRPRAAAIPQPAGLAECARRQAGGDRVGIVWTNLAATDRRFTGASPCDNSGCQRYRPGSPDQGG